MAREAGAPSVLVLSGTSNAEDVASTPMPLRPDLVVDVVGDLRHHLSEE
jgi:ribonucleotide monophosphatase NagD (HAD superfamily)